MIRRLADTFPQASVAIVGEVRVPLGPLEGAPNVHLLGRKPYAELSSET